MYHISFNIDFCVHKMSYVSSCSLWNDRQNVSKYRIKSKVYIKMINQGIHNFNPVSFTIYHIKNKHTFFLITCKIDAFLVFMTAIYHTGKCTYNLSVFMKPSGES